MPDDASLAVLPSTFPNAVQSDNTTADAYAPPALPKGLCYDAEGQVRIRPEIEVKLDELRWQRAYQLILQGRNGEANSYIGCHLIHKVTKRCSQWHEAHVAPIRCGKPFICDDCGSTASRVSQFHYEHPHLYDLLITSAFSVLTFTIHEPAWDYTQPHVELGWERWVRNNLERAKDKFKRFMDLYPTGDHGWHFVAAFSDNEDDINAFETTKFFAIHTGDKLPSWPTLSAQWKQIAGADATFRTKLYDGHDGDDQSKGLKLAFSGFDAYYETVSNLGGWAEIDLSNVFAGFRTAMPYGAFRGLDAETDEYDKVDEGDPVAAAEPPKDNCGICSEPLMRDDKPLFMTIDEIISKGARIFSHITKPTYRRNSKPEASTCTGHEHGDG